MTLVAKLRLPRMLPTLLLLASAMVTVAPLASADSVSAAVESASPPAAEQAAAESVAQFHQVLLRAMQAPGGYSQRLALVTPAVQEFLAVRAIAKICLGRTWRQLSAPEQGKFVQLLGEVVAATYADRFSGFSGQQFVTLSTAQARGGVVVKTQLVRPDQEPVRLDYYFRRGKAFNVVANGVSDLSLRRADYSAIVKAEGFAALLQHLSQQAQAGENL